MYFEYLVGFGLAGITTCCKCLLDDQTMAKELLIKQELENFSFRVVRVQWKDGRMEKAHQLHTYT